METLSLDEFLKSSTVEERIKIVMEREDDQERGSRAYWIHECLKVAGPQGYEYITVDELRQIRAQKIANVATQR